MANGKFGGGNGTTAAPYLVEDEADLLAISNNLTKHFKQSKDIRITQTTNWAGIGSLQLPFTGTFDGAGYSIFGITIKIRYSGQSGSSSGYDYWYTGNSYYAYHTYRALFNVVSTPGVLRNVSVKEMVADYRFSPTEESTHGGYSGANIIAGIVGRYDSTVALVNCHSEITVESELPRRYYSNAATSCSSFYIAGLVVQSYTGSTSCSSKITINHRPVVGVQNVVVCVSPHTYTTTSGGVVPDNQIVKDFKFTMDINYLEPTDDFTGKTSSSSQIYWDNIPRNCEDCEIKDVDFRIRTINGIKISHNATTRLVSGKATRCSLINCNLEVYGTGNYFAPFEEAIDCKVLNCSLINTNASNTSTGVAYGMSLSTSTRCLIKDSYVEGVNNAAGMGPGNATDCHVSNTNIKSAGRVSGVVSGEANVLRCIFSGGWVEGNNSHLGGLLTATVASYSVKNSFFLGQYVKGLGATTVQSGLISALGHTGNSNNYALTTSQLILE